MVRFELKQERREEKEEVQRELQAGRKGWAAKGFNEDERDKPTSGSVSLPIHLHHLLLHLSFSHTFPLHSSSSSTFSSLFSFLSSAFF